MKQSYHETALDGLLESSPPTTLKKQKSNQQHLFKC